MATITDNTYYKNEIYIPHAKPSITKGVTGVSGDVDAFINEYERECLIKCLGFKLAKELIDRLDAETPTRLKAESDVKWNNLLNGCEYVNLKGDTKFWRGIRFKSGASDAYDMSFLAYYVYFFYETNYNTARSSTGHQEVKSKNSVNAGPNAKITNAWRKFFKLVQNTSRIPKVYVTANGVGVDYYGDGDEITLYQFINDSNALVPDTYADFKATVWDNINQFGI